MERGAPPRNLAFSYQIATDRVLGIAEFPRVVGIEDLLRLLPREPWNPLLRHMQRVAQEPDQVSRQWPWRLGDGRDGVLHILSLQTFPELAFASQVELAAPDQSPHLRRDLLTVHAHGHHRPRGRTVRKDLDVVEMVGACLPVALPTAELPHLSPGWRHG